jgi:FkbH-like protein/FkbM family methyltransferase
MKIPAHFSSTHSSPMEPPEAVTEFRVGVGSVPYLGDHGFQDMVVLPGSYYIEMALRMEREASGRVPRLVRNVKFHNPVILSARDTVIKVGVKNHGDGRAEYAFYEGGPALQLATSLEIDRDLMPISEIGGLSIEAFQAQASAVITAEQFYRTLRDNGNQYGPRFQNVSSIWRAGNQALGKLSVASEHNKGGPHCLHPSLLDSMAQLLAPFLTGKSRTLVLRSIDRLALWDTAFPDTLWGCATLLSGHEGDDTGGVGDVRIFDQSGRPYLELGGIAFTLLDRADAGDGKAATNLLIGSNFTAQPLEDSLKFWGDHFGVPVRPEFAPYDQVFQQLLDTGSAFRRNRDGVNVILLSLEEWAAGDRQAAMTLSREQADQCFGNRPRCVLPNGLEIAHLNRYETDYLYQEIFEEQCYLRHGIRLDDGATVVDIGANIGLFSLFVMSRCANATVYACEPAPVVYELLKANCDAYGSNVRALNVGVSDRPKTATFTFYEKSSVFSGFHSDEAEDRRAIQTVVRSMLESEAMAGESVEEYVKELTADRLQGRSHECRMTSVSDIIRENRIDRIDLLKIDAEKSELDILAGIEDRDWPKIGQIVLEIHDRTHAAAERIESLLVEKGYRCAVERQTLLERAGLVNLYATRRAAGEVDVATTVHREREKTGNLEGKVRDFCAALRSFMDQAAAPLVLCMCPGTPAAQANTALAAALSDAEQTLLAEAAAIRNVHAIGAASLLRRYPVADYYDPHGHQLGHVPYTPAGYAAIGTAVFRAIFNLRTGPFKVIVLDCDNTLWKGVCGEDGPTGIEVTAAHRALQEFMIGQMNAGMLLCLCSKNNESDVLDVFDQRNDMPLKREHLVSWRINWNSKSGNLHSLAAELGLGLDSFIFLDDNPVDCADVRINCPEVVTLQLPGNADSFPAFLNHAWAFDRAGSTAEDRNRTRMYQEGARRQRYREQSLSLKDFIRGLELRVEIAEVTPDQLARVSQLTFRTNQFNFTTIRRTESEIGALLKRGGTSCLTVRVADRFGDYGLVGVVIYESDPDCYKVDTLLLSCRVLGRGVEHALLSRLGERALENGKEFVEVRCVSTGKNQLALEFMASLGAGYQNDDGDGASWIFPAEHLARLRYAPEETARIGDAAEADAEPSAPRAATVLGGASRSERLQRIAEDLRDVDQLARAVEKHRLGDHFPAVAAETVAGSALETALADIWRKVLGRPRIELNDNFFEAGGTSLKAVQVIATIKRELKQTLSIVSLFECPTVALLAAKIRATSADAGGGSTAAAAALRGKRRRAPQQRTAARLVT